MKSIFKLAFVLILVWNSLYSQSSNYKIIYDYQYIRDTITEPKIYSKKEAHILVRNDYSSIFISYPNYLNDSAYVKNSKYGYRVKVTQENGQEILDEFFQLRKNDLPSISRIKLTKNYKEKKINSWLNGYISYNYKFTDDIISDWEMTGKSDTLMGMLVYQAKTNYGGRIYNAWYAPEIPISDGPYVFSGLPGLIIKIADEKDWYVFQLQRVDLNPSSVEFYEQEEIGTPPILTRTQFVDMLRKEKNNPRFNGIIDATQSDLLKVKNAMARKFDYLMESY